MLHAIASAFIGAVAFISSLFGVVPREPHYVFIPPTENLGTALPSGTAVFETSLQSRISSTDTSLTLVANSVRGGSSLSGYNCFTVDEGRTDAEYLCGTVSGTSVTSLTRGIDPSTGTTSNSALKFAHRVGANVKITDFPLLQILRNQANGADTYPNPLRYAAGVMPSTVDDLTDKGYVDGIAFSGAGVIDASTVAKGVVELATGAEAAASTATGSSGKLVLPASQATSTYNSATAVNVIPVTGAGGKIDSQFIATSSLYAFSFPASKGASSTVLMTDSAGAVTWESVSTLTTGSTTPSIALNGSTASTTIYQATIPANSIGPNGSLRITLHDLNLSALNSASVSLDVGFGNASTTVIMTNGSGGTLGGIGPLEFTVRNMGATNSQRSALTFYGPSANTVGALSGYFVSTSKTMAIDTTAAVTVTIVAKLSNASNTLTTDFQTTEVLRQ